MQVLMLFTVLTLSNGPSKYKIKCSTKQADISRNANNQVPEKRKTELYHGRSLKGHNSL